MRDCFQANEYQAAVARWLHLPQCLLGGPLGEVVAAWSVHPLADFQEMITLHFPYGLVNSYLNICNIFFLLHQKPAGISSTCVFRDLRGRLCCDKQTRNSRSSFCSYNHSLQKQYVGTLVFEEDDWGADYLRILQGDLIVDIPTDWLYDGWAYGLNARSLETGWFPLTHVR
mgnify:CR=1 FL=1